MDGICVNPAVNSILLLKERIIKVETLLEKCAQINAKHNDLNKLYHQAIENEKKAKKDAAKYLEKYCRLSKKCEILHTKVKDLEDLVKVRSDENENLKNELDRVQLVLQIYKTERNVVEDIQKERHFLITNLWNLLKEADLDRHKNIADGFFKRFNKDLKELKLDDFRCLGSKKISKDNASKPQLSRTKVLSPDMVSMESGFSDHDDTESLQHVSLGEIDEYLDNGSWNKIQVLPEDHSRKEMDNVSCALKANNSSSVNCKGENVTVVPSHNFVNGGNDFVKEGSVEPENDRLFMPQVEELSRVPSDVIEKLTKEPDTLNATLAVKDIINSSPVKNYTCDSAFTLNKQTRRTYAGKMRKFVSKVDVKWPKLSDISSGDIDCCDNSAQTVELNMDQLLGELKVSDNFKEKREENNDKIFSVAVTDSLHCKNIESDQLLFSSTGNNFEMDNSIQDVSVKETVNSPKNLSIFDIPDEGKVERKKSGSNQSPDLADVNLEFSLGNEDILQKDCLSVKGLVPSQVETEDRTLRSGDGANENRSNNEKPPTGIIPNKEFPVEAHTHGHSVSENKEHLGEQSSENVTEIPDHEIFTILKSVNNFRLLSPIKDKGPNKCRPNVENVNGGGNSVSFGGCERSQCVPPKAGAESLNAPKKHAVRRLDVECVEKEGTRPSEKGQEDVALSKKLTEDKCTQTDLENDATVEEDLHSGLRKGKKLKKITSVLQDMEKIWKIIWKGKLPKKTKRFDFFVKWLNGHSFYSNFLDVLLKALTLHKCDFERQWKEVKSGLSGRRKFKDSKNKTCRKKILPWKIEDMESNPMCSDDLSGDSSLVNHLGQKINEFAAQSQTEMEGIHKSFEWIVNKNFDFMLHKPTDAGIDSDYYGRNISVKKLMPDVFVRQCAGNADSYKKEIHNFSNPGTCCMLNSLVNNSINFKKLCFPMHDDSASGIVAAGSISGQNGAEFSEISVMKTETSDGEKPEYLEYAIDDVPNPDLCRFVEMPKSATKYSAESNHNKQLKLMENGSLPVDLSYEMGSGGQPKTAVVDLKRTDCDQADSAVEPRCAEKCMRDDLSIESGVSRHCKSLSEKYQLLFGEADDPVAGDVTENFQLHSNVSESENVETSDSLDNHQSRTSPSSTGKYNHKRKIPNCVVDSKNVKVDSNKIKTYAGGFCARFNDSTDGAPIPIPPSPVRGNVRGRENEILDVSNNSRENDKSNDETPSTHKRRRFALRSASNEKVSKIGESTTFSAKRKTKLLRGATRDADDRNESKVKNGDNILDFIMTEMTKQAEEFKTKPPPVLKPVFPCDPQMQLHSVIPGNIQQEPTVKGGDVQRNGVTSDDGPVRNLVGDEDIREMKSLNDKSKIRNDHGAMNMKKLVEMEINKFLKVEINTVEEAEEKIRPCIKVLENSDEDIIANAIVAEILTNVDEKLQEFDRPAPPLTQTQHRIMTVLSVLTDSGERFPRISYKILKTIRSKLFPETFFWPDDALEMAARFYTALCKKLNDFKVIWKFCFKAIACMRQRWCLAVFVVLQVWPDILLNATNIKDNIPLNTFVNLILQTPNSEEMRRKRQMEKLLALKHLLINFYNFEVVSTMEMHTENLYGLFLDDAPGAVHALILVAQCRTWKWTKKNIIFKLSQTLNGCSTGDVSDEIGMRALDVIDKISSSIPDSDDDTGSPVAPLASAIVRFLHSSHAHLVAKDKVIRFLCKVRQHYNVDEVLKSELQQLSPDEALHGDITKIMASTKAKAKQNKSRNDKCKGKAKARKVNNPKETGKWKSLRKRNDRKKGGPVTRQRKL